MPHRITIRSRGIDEEDETSRVLHRPVGAGALALACPCGAQAAVEGRRHYVRPPAAAGHRAGRQGRGGRVLLVRLPALQRVRAHAGGLGKGCPTFVVVRRVPVQFREPSARCSACLRARGHGPARTLHRKVFAAIQRSPEAMTPAEIRPRREERADGAKFIEVTMNLRGADQGRQACSWPRPTDRRRARRWASRAASTPRHRRPAAGTPTLSGRLPDPVRVGEGG